MSKNRAREHAPGLHKSVSTKWCSCKKLSELGNQILGLKCMMVVGDMERRVITHRTWSLVATNFLVLDGGFDEDNAARGSSPELPVPNANNVSDSRVGWHWKIKDFAFLFANCYVRLSHSIISSVFVLSLLISLHWFFPTHLSPIPSVCSYLSVVSLESLKQERAPDLTRSYLPHGPEREALSGQTSKLKRVSWPQNRRVTVSSEHYHSKMHSVIGRRPPKPQIFSSLIDSCHSDCTWKPKPQQVNIYSLRGSKHQLVCSFKEGKTCICLITNPVGDTRRCSLLLTDASHFISCRAENLFT
jgi:hypothetical protein